MSLESEAASLGIPMKIVVDDKLRYSYCDAHEAVLVSLEGKHAIYKGQCANGHRYEVKRLVSELQAEFSQKLQFINGRLSLGREEGFKAGDLEEF